MPVKRNEFVQHVANHQCYFHRHGGKHAIYQNANSKKGNGTTPPKVGKISLRCNLQTIENPQNYNPPIFIFAVHC